MGEFFEKFGGYAQKKETILAGGKYGGNFPEIWRKYAQDSKQNTIGRRKLWGNFSRNLGKICANFQKTPLAGGSYGGIFPEIWREETTGEFSGNVEKVCANFKRNNIGGTKLWGNFSLKFGENMREIPKNIIGGRKLWGIQYCFFLKFAHIFSKFLEKFPHSFLSPILFLLKFGHTFWKKSLIVSSRQYCCLEIRAYLPQISGKIPNTFLPPIVFLGIFAHIFSKFLEKYRILSSCQYCFWDLLQISGNIPPKFPPANIVSVKICAYLRLSRNVEKICDKF